MRLPRETDTSEYASRSLRECEEVRTFGCAKVSVFPNSLPSSLTSSIELLRVGCVTSCGMAKSWNTTVEEGAKGEIDLGEFGEVLIIAPLCCV